MTKYSDQEEWQQLVDDCEERESRLSDWENKFVDSISDRLFKMISLTEKQSETLNKIWEKATEKG